MVDAGTRRNVIAYYLNFVVAAAIGFIVSPFLLSALGPLMFGVWKSLQRYLDFATVADGRASQALKWIVASRTALTDEEKRRDIGAAINVWFRWLPAATLIAAGITMAMPLLIKGIPDDARHVAYATAAILAGNTVLAGLLAIPDSVLTGINQGYKSMLITTAAFIVSNVAMVLAASFGLPLWSLAAIVLLAAVANAGLTLLIAKRAVPWWGMSRPTSHDMRRVFGYSAWTLGSTIVEKLFLASELIVVSVMLGAVVVTQYTFTTFVMQFILSISLVTASGFLPTLGSQFGASQTAAVADLAKSVRHLVIGVAVLGSAGVLALNGAFITLWVGAGQYLGTTINTLLVVCGLQLAFIRMDGQIIDVTMRMAPKVIAGLLSVVGGIIAGCIGFALTHSLVVAFAAVIVVRLPCNVVYAMLVARSIPGSAVPRRPVVLAVMLLTLSVGIGPLAQSSGLLAKAGLAMGWVLLAGAAAWCGLVPRSTVRGLIGRGA